MTSPVVRTPVYGLRKFADGQPLADVGVIVNNNADNVEAALVLGGVAPTDTQTLLAELAAFRTVRDAGLFDTTAWADLTLLSGFIAFGGASNQPQWRMVAGRRIELRGLVGPSSGTFAQGAHVATIPASVTVSGRVHAIRPDRDVRSEGAASDGTIRRITVESATAATPGRLLVNVTGAATGASWVALDLADWAY